MAPVAHSTPSPLHITLLRFAPRARGAHSRTRGVAKSTRTVETSEEPFQPLRSLSRASARDHRRHRIHPRVRTTSGRSSRACEQTGSIRAPDVTEIVESHELSGLEHEALVRELDKRGIEIVEAPPVERAAVAPAPRRDDDRRAPALPPRGRPAPAAERGAGGRAREADRARRRHGEVRDDPGEPPPGRLDREELPQPGPPVPRSHPGGHAGPDPRGREVRLAARLQVLHVRHLVDQAGRRARARRQGAHDPHAGAHRRAHAEDQPGRAVALDAARSRADDRGDRRRGLGDARADPRGARRGPRLDEPRRSRRRRGRRRLRRLRRRRRAAARGDGRRAAPPADAPARAALAARARARGR